MSEPERFHVAGLMRTGSTITANYIDHAMGEKHAAERHHNLNVPFQVLTTRHPYTWVSSMLEWMRVEDPHRNLIASLVHHWTSYYDAAIQRNHGPIVVKVEDWWDRPEDQYNKLVNMLDVEDPNPFKHIKAEASPVKGTPTWTLDPGQRARTKVHVDPTSTVREDYTVGVLELLGYDLEPPGGKA